MPSDPNVLFHSPPPYPPPLVPIRPLSLKLLLHYTVVLLHIWCFIGVVKTIIFGPKQPANDIIKFTVVQKSMFLQDLMHVKCEDGLTSDFRIL